MTRQKGLIIIHVDGLSHANLHRALAAGRMPFVQQLLDKEGYDVQAYRCGIPSTTPFAQAGILYGDNREISSFRWWDKESGLLVAFGPHSSFKHVAHKYFQDCEPLIQGGACIAACYPAGSVDNLGIAYLSLADTAEPHHIAQHVLSSLILNPLHLADWAARGLWQIWNANLQYWRARLESKPAAPMYVLSDLGEEIFLHQITRIAVIEALQRDYP